MIFIADIFHTTVKDVNGSVDSGICLVCGHHGYLEHAQEEHAVCFEVAKDAYALTGHLPKPFVS